MPHLFMVLAGCSPRGRNTEQHDVFFGIGETMKELIPALKEWWPEAGLTLHIDAWRQVSYVNGHAIEIRERTDTENPDELKLFFINLGGYKENEFDEFHYKILNAAPGKKEAIQQSKQTAFFKHTTLKGARSHIDDKFGVDVDDIYEITDILSAMTKERYRIYVSPQRTDNDDIVNLGYFKLNSFG
jgi:hypothetical protein